MKKLNNKLFGSGLLVLAFSLNTYCVNAQTCTTSPSCEALGFIQSSSDCEGRESIRCPFDMNKVFCGGDNPCGVGAILYSDKSCSSGMISGKAPIGIVFDEALRLAIALEGKSGIAWSEAEELFNTSDAGGKENTKTAMEYCKTNGISCPAFEYVSSYETVGTNAGDWFLPSAMELGIICKNGAVLDDTISKNKNGLPGSVADIKFSSIGAGSYWTSDEKDERQAYATMTYNCRTYQRDKNTKMTGMYALPVLAF